jgi:alkylated DNA repair dioxygenase AlkB
MNPFDALEDEGRQFRIQDDGIDLVYDADFLEEEAADRLFKDLTTALPWHRGAIRMPDGVKPIPRMTSWHADKPLTYSYSGLTHPWKDWTPGLAEVRDRIEAATGERFNGVLANFYENERDSVSPHADDESGLEARSPIASVTLGAVRDFIVRHMRTGSRHVLALGHGSLLLMGGDTQKVSQHAIPKLKHPCGARINLTFRKAIIR